MRILVLILAVVAFTTPSHDADPLHLKACYAKARSESRPLVAFYREVEVVELPAGTYTAVPFNGGYVGLAGPKRPHINFSIWDTKVDGEVVGEAELIAASAVGDPHNHRFGHEGSGFHSELDFAWEPGVRYKVFVTVSETTEDGEIWTTFTSWFGEVGDGAEDEPWHFIASIRRPLSHQLGAAGGFLEHVGKRGSEERRESKFGGGWTCDGNDWLPVEVIRYQCKDPAASNARINDDMLSISIGLGIASEHGETADFEFDRSGDELPTLPEGWDDLR